MKKKSPKEITKECLSILRELSNSYPAQSLCQHIFIATSDYPSPDFLTDKEFLFSLNKYKTEKDLDYSSSHEGEMDKIIREGQDLLSLMQDGEEDDY